MMVLMQGSMKILQSIYLLPEHQRQSSLSWFADTTLMPCQSYQGLWVLIPVVMMLSHGRRLRESREEKSYFLVVTYIFQADFLKLTWISSELCIFQFHFRSRRCRWIPFSQRECFFHVVLSRYLDVPDRLRDGGWTLESEVFCKLRTGAQLSRFQIFSVNSETQWMARDREKVQKPNRDTHRFVYTSASAFLHTLLLRIMPQFHQYLVKRLFLTRKPAKYHSHELTWAIPNIVIDPFLCLGPITLKLKHWCSSLHISHHLAASFVPTFAVA